MTHVRKNILITGASSGIGLASAKALAARRHRVFAAARKPVDLEALRAQGFDAVPLDLANSASIRAAIAQVLDQTGGRLDVLFNNATYGQPGAVEDLSRDTLRAQFEVNVFGTFELTRGVIPVMRRQESGWIIQNSSLQGFVAMPYCGAYCGTKYALEGLTDALRLELTGSGIRVVLIEPGPILSRFRENAYQAYARGIEPSSSVHSGAYGRLAARLLQPGPAAPFTLPPEAVAKKVVQAVESAQPRARYFVTVPSYLFWYIKGIIPTSWLDAVLRRV